MASSTLPTVTAVVSTYNRCNYLSQSLDSLLAQTYPLTQLIVVNDGSTDATGEVAAKYGDRIEYYEQKNQGKAAAVNSVIPYIRGDYVWIFDDDDVALPDAVERHIQAFEARSRDDAFTYGTYLEGFNDSLGNIVPGRNRLAPTVDSDVFLVSLLTRCFLLTQAMLVPTSAIRAVNGFDSQLVRSQDYDLFIKLARRFKPIRVQGPLFILRVHDGQRGSEADRFGIEERAHRWHKYEKLIVQRLSNDLALNEYLPKSLQSEYLLEPQLARAHLQRFAICAIRGLWTEALPDLYESNRMYSGKSLSLEEKKICWDAMSEWLALEEIFNSESLMKTYRKAFSEISREISIPLLKGIYYTLRKEPRSSRWLAMMRGLIRAI